MSLRGLGCHTSPLFCWICHSPRFTEAIILLLSSQLMLLSPIWFVEDVAPPLASVPFYFVVTSLSCSALNSVPPLSYTEEIMPPYVSGKHCITNLLRVLYFINPKATINENTSGLVAQDPLLRFYQASGVAR